MLCCNSSSLISHLLLVGIEALDMLAADLQKGRDKMFYSKNNLMFVTAELGLKLRLERESASRWTKESGSALRNCTLC